MEVSKHQPASPVEANPYPRWFTQLGLVLSSCGLLFFLWEWYTIGIMADQEKINDYRFGTEPMLSEGGSHYGSAATYAAAALHDAVFVWLPLTIVFALAVRKGTRLYQLIAVAAVVVAGLLNLLL